MSAAHEKKRQEEAERLFQEYLAATKDAYDATWTRIDEIERILNEAGKQILEMHLIGKRLRHIRNGNFDQIGNLQAPLCSECEAADELEELHR